MARPTDYNEGILQRARDYRDNPLPEDEVIHSIEGLALYMGINRSTIYDWASQEDKQEFSNIVADILAKQGKTLINKGLSNAFNSKITAVMMSKHGYREGHEHTGKDGAGLFNPSKEEQEAANKALEAIQ